MWKALSALRFIVGGLQTLPPLWRVALQNPLEF